MLMTAVMTSVSAFDEDAVSALIWLKTVSVSVFRLLQNSLDRATISNTSPLTLIVCQMGRKKRKTHMRHAFDLAHQ